ncbi:MAG: KilA-N domain-containing protein [Bacteroidales bacterium]|nr:KilA-N domain-containing protein [Bacteroidales bacterium]
MNKNKQIQVQGSVISIISRNDKDYICLTDMAKAFEDGNGLIENWLRNKNTVEFLGIWERLNNPDFNSVEFDGIMMQVGLNRFKLSAKKWVESTNAIGLIAKTGKYGGTYAHTDIAYHFGMWLSPEFNLLVIKEFQRLKEEEQKQLKSAEWLYHRFTAKANYVIQTDAIQKYLIPLSALPKDKLGIIYASEAELINFATLGYTSKQWSEEHADLVVSNKNHRDYLPLEALIVLDNMQSFNSYLISQNLSKEQRFELIQKESLRQFEALSQSKTIQTFKQQEKLMQEQKSINLLESKS